ncbi:dienelactone hydrolase family protein [Rhodoblastus acidophilus]|nr:dienelactone hydrolase family protein [Candidatus Rhodoblastus alkanivorans]MDI4640905.1 dienelactone hydrolase family protein [Rhodoblastus acidophilus]
MAEIIEGPKLAALSCGKPVYLVVLLHGEGGSGQDMADLALGWVPEMIKADFVALEAPFRDPEGRAVWREAERPQSFAESAAALDSFLDAQLATTRLPASHLALVGFGQGAELALTVGLRRPQKLAALVGFSGAYPTQTLPDELADPAPTLLVHGDADARYSAMLALKDALKARGAPVWSFKRPGLGHEIDGDGADAAGAFLAKHVRHVKEDHDHD